MNAKIIIAGFRKMGIYPHNPQVISAESLAPSLVTDRESVGNGGEALLEMVVRLSSVLVFIPPSYVDVEISFRSSISWSIFTFLII